MIAKPAALALAATLVLSFTACSQPLTAQPQPQAAPSPAASLVLKQTRPQARLQTQQLVPDLLAVPAGNVLFRSLIGVGEQLYTCAATGAGFAWTFAAPRAELYNFNFRKVGTHFAGPTWRDSADGSAVVGRVVQNVPAPFSLDGQPAIPWLLLEVASTTPAANGAEGTFTPTTFVRRLFTVGGVGPTSGCVASTVGRNLGVPYASLYEFYRARKP